MPSVNEPRFQASRAHEHAEDIGDRDGQRRERDGVRQDREDDVEDRRLHAERGAKLTAERIAEIEEILLGQRTVEAELLAEGLLLLGSKRGVDIGQRRVAGHQPEHEERRVATAQSTKRLGQSEPRSTA